MESWSIDPEFSSVTFSIPNIGQSVVKGRFSEWTGHMELDEGGALSGSIEMSIFTASLRTGDAKLDAEATSSRFLDAATFPAITFAGDEVLSHDGDDARVRGMLRVKDVSAPIVVSARQEGRARDLTGHERMSYEVTTRISRSEFGLLWHPALENVAGFVIGDTIQITADIEFVRDE